jgi:hypothetical protein
MKLINDIFLKSHKVLKDIYYSKKIMYALGLKYEKIDVCSNNHTLF